MTKEEINNKYQIIYKERLRARGCVVGMILDRDGYIESGDNDKEIVKLDDVWKSIVSLFKEISVENFNL